MFIETQITPNPQTLKFVPGVEVLKSGTWNFTDCNDAEQSPLAKEIFKIKGVKAVFLATDFITVTKGSEHEWEYLKPIVLAAIMDHYMSGMPIINVVREVANNNNSLTINNDELTKQIIELIETRVRPAVAEDGGDIVFKDFKKGVVYLELHGACSGCPSSTITLKNGIENMLKHYVPEVEKVEAI